MSKYHSANLKELSPLKRVYNSYFHEELEYIKSVWLQQKHIYYDR